MPKVTAFIARSFSSLDEQRLRRTLDFLATFERAGFFCESAEPAEVESVSVKVRRIIDQNDVFIGFFTKRHPIYNGNLGLPWFRRLFSRLAPEAWSSPPWVLQESGYALAKNKKLILLRESGVETPGLHGDLEYIPFGLDDESQVFSKLSEMINALLAEMSGRRIELSVRDEKSEQPTADEPSVPVEKAESEAPRDKVPAAPSLAPHFFDLIEASASKDLAKVEESYKAGKELISSGSVTTVDLLVWEGLGLQHKFTAGSANALDELRKLASENPTRPEPPMRIAQVLFDSQEYEEAAGFFLKASSLAKPKSGFRATCLAKAAKAYLQLHQNDKAQAIAWDAYRESEGDQKREISSLLYEILKEQKELLFAFGIAEAAIRDNPHHLLRFQLGLDYFSARLHDLFLLHFDHICRADPTNFSAVHNLALALSSCGLPIASVEQYRKAIEGGETLSAANLGYRYLDAGMAADTKELLQPVMKLDVHDSRVDRCFSEIGSRGKDEEERRAAVLQAAHDRRKFFVQIGEGLQQKAGAIDGEWAFPFGKITLTVKEGGVSGSTEIQTPQTGFGQLLSQGGPDPVKTEIYTLRGTLAGTVCKFTLAIENKDLRGTVFARSETKEGLIVFKSNGANGVYAEISKDASIGDRQSVARLSSAVGA
jgi:tetratricopeptide (TPR) repeat protein